MSLLVRKALREIRLMKGQCLAIAVLIALATGTFVGAAGTHRSLERSRDAYYSNQRLGDVFAEVARAPREIEARLAALPGVAAVEARLATGGLLLLPGFDEPATARLVGLPDSGIPSLGRLHLRRGRLPEPGLEAEAVISEAMAEAQGVSPGDRLAATINGRRIDLSVVGVGLSPEHVYEVRPGEMFPDNLRYGVLWVPATVLEEALDMRGAFNEVVVELDVRSAASRDEVIAAVDNLLDRYGGLGAYGRDRHVSARFVEEELQQLEATAFFVPAIFLAVAAFLLNVIVGRLIATQREQIATLKALGFGNGAIGLHYAGFTAIVVTAGCAAGVGIGYAFAAGMISLYADYFRFARFEYALSAGDVVVAFAAGLLAALAGTAGAVRKAVRLRPAEAMRPPAPAVYRRSPLERLGLHRLLSTSGRMVLRNLSRRPLRAAASSVGIAFAVALLVLGLFFTDAMEAIIDGQFRQAQRQDLTVTFSRPVAAGALFELARLPGVWRAEPRYEVAATLRRGHRSYRTVVTGLPRGAALQRVLDERGEVLEIPPHGLLLSDILARNIGARLGDEIDVELLEGRRNTVRATVAAIVDEPFGTSAYASLETARELASTGSRITSTLLRVDERLEPEIFNRLGSLPAVLAVSSRKSMLRSFNEMIDEVMLAFAGVLTIFAGAMAVGVAYNAARISLSERERELATMRVIGMTRAEISTVLLGELAVLTALALPLGCAFGNAFARATANSASTEMYRIPLVIAPSTYLFAMAVVLASVALVAIVVRSRLGRLNLVSVLKTKE